ncbi:TraB/GumN family protein [Brumimicrobium oceani]|uniref:TraB/GumN family protein n=1 Tax=Brumimicrobium oceani TaxID=2100725 RepID=A0A2U2X597_9FLAO|nr:TraB/GumN family protein [Brumimicrobium oceani]PWH82967.1 hypothetical protein DIT68_13815 [Brumimicrobium oceani]
MRKSLIFFIALLSFHSLAQQKDIDRSNYQLFWEITRGDSEAKAYLFGTYHSNDSDVFDFPDELYPALLNAEAVILETDITDFMLEESTVVPDVGYEKSNLLQWVVPARATDKVTYTAYGSDEGRPQFIDMYFKQVADNCNKVFHPLETLEDQMKIGLLNEVDPNAQKNIKLISREELKQKYLEGNASDIHKYTRNSTLEYIDLYKDLIVDRNIKMTAGIDTLIHQHKSSFIAVGASHLLGPQGIVPLLRQKGYTLKVVKSEFSKNKSQAEIDLQQCNQYNYKDERYAVSLKFGGKPALKELGNADRLIRYQELGQGNTYSLSIYNYGVEVNLTKHLKDYFSNPNLTITHFDSLLIGNIKAYQGLLKSDEGNDKWVRIIKKGNVLYNLSAEGGYRFMNSNRHLSFFNGFQFLNRKTDESLSENVMSTSKTMHLKFPKHYFSETRTLEYDHIWEAKWDNPNAREFLYAHESIMTDNSISYTNKEFGTYILSKYPADSVKIEEEKREIGKYHLKSYTAQLNGYTVYGKIRQVGNMIQFIEYIGNDKSRRALFLSSFDTLHAFPAVKEELSLSNADFETVSTTKNLQLDTVKNDEQNYRDIKVYSATDVETGISHHVLIKKFNSWAFSQKDIKTLLIDQLQWPLDGGAYEIDSVFTLNSSTPHLDFSLYYPDTENLFKGKATLVGKTIVIASLTYPKAAEVQYEDLAFLDSMKFTANNQNLISEMNIPMLKNEIMVNGGEAVENLIFDGHLNDSILKVMLDWSPQFWNSFDEQGALLSAVIVSYNWNLSDKTVINYWKESSHAQKELLTVSTLYTLQEAQDPEGYLSVIEEAKNKETAQIDLYRLLMTRNADTDFLSQVWPAYAELLEDSLSWNFSFMLPQLLETEFYQDYFTSEQFSNAVLKESQPPWAAFRYFEIMYEHGIPRVQFSRLLKKWGETKNDHKTGSIAAWKTIIGEKISRKEKRLIKKDAAVAISYSKVMAVSETPVFELLSYEEMIGYIAFDHYKDAYFDKDKSLSYIENRTITVKEEKVNFAIFKVVENDKTYFMAREIPKDKLLPSYGGFGSNTFFIYGSEEYQPKVIEEELVKKIEG